MTDLLIVGAGPTGLTAAAEAVRHGLSVRIVDVNSTRSIYSKALVLHSRTLEIFTDMGFVDEVLQSGQEFRALNIYAEGKALTRIDFRALDWQDAIYPFWLSLPQSDTERLLEEHLARLGVHVERQTKLTHLTQQDEQVQATLARLDENGETISEEIVTTSWLIGCDGASSTTRKLCDIAYEGTAKDEVFILGDVQIDWAQQEDEGQNFMSADGILLVVPLPQPKQYRIIAHMPALSGEQAPVVSLELLQSLMDERTGLESHLYDLEWHSNFSVKHLVAANHRQERVFLAGDAAHIHSPVGGQGLNTGIQDAYNLMWKLALVHQGKATEKLLDSYEIERHEVAEATIKRVRFATNVVTLKNPLSRAIRNQLASILVNMDMVQNRMGRDVGMLDISYDSSDVVNEDRVENGRVLKLLKGIGANGSDVNAVNSGDRAPNVLFLDEAGVPHSFVDFLYGTEYTLLLFMGLRDRKPSATLYQIQEMIVKRYPNIIRTCLVTTTTLPPAEWTGEMIVNSGGAIHRRYGAVEEALYLCRPDHHIGYMSQPVSFDLLVAYLDEILLVDAV